MKKIIVLLLCSLFLLSCANTNPKIGSAYKDFFLSATTKPNITKNQYEAFAPNYMIASQGDASTQAGVQMFELGGNAIDAAAAVSFAISVERPQSTGIGGGGFMMLHFAQEEKTLAVDFREKAPLKATRDMYLDKNRKIIPGLSLNGAKSAGVPGLVAGVIEVQAKYGKLSLEQVIAPAIALAEKGFPVYPHLARSIEHRKKVLQKFPESRKVFFHKDGTPLQEGDLLIQKDLAKTLRAISKNGKAGFYSGWVADKIVANQKKYQGLISHKDLQKYEVKYREPIWGTYKEYKIASMPPPSSGGTHVIQILNILEQDNLKQYGPLAPESIHLTASAMQMAFADRAKYLGDSDFVRVPHTGIAAKSYAKKLRKKIHENMAMPSSLLTHDNPWPFVNKYESDETTHFTVMDSFGNTVSSTQTINYLMGSGLVVGGTGIVLNDEMDDFSVKPGSSNVFGALGGSQNAVHAEKRPLSSMSPTIVFDGNKPKLALGTPSGTRIITCVAQTILNYLEYELPLYESVAMLRYHHQYSPDEIRMDEPGLPENVVEKLRHKGYSVRKKNLGCKINAIAREKSLLHGVSDPRGEGLSRGN